jgi:hypothetical protein
MSTFDTITHADAHRNAYNAAFHELGLRFYWDSEHYSGGLCANGERDCLRRYLEQHQPHLLRAYDADFLVDAIQAAKERCYGVMTADGCRPGAFINWAEIARHHVGA